MVPKFLFAHHKCASRFSRAFLEKMGFRVLNYIDFLEEKVILENMDELDISTLDERLAISSNGENYVISIINTTGRVLNFINQRIGDNYKALHVIRDPRDILISAYFHHLDGHPVDNKYFYWPELEYVREKLKASTKEKGILIELNSITKRVINDQISCVPQAENILTVKIEDFSSRNYEVIQGISKFWDLSLTDPAADIYVPVGKSQVRKDSGDWEQHFSPKVKDEFKLRHGDLLVNLEYEDDIYW